MPNIFNGSEYIFFHYPSILQSNLKKLPLRNLLEQQDPVTYEFIPNINSCYSFIIFSFLFKWTPCHCCSLLLRTKKNNKKWVYFDNSIIGLRIIGKHRVPLCWCRWFKKSTPITNITNVSLLSEFLYAMGQTIVSKQNFRNVIENISSVIGRILLSPQDSDLLILWSNTKVDTAVKSLCRWD